jgi:hypothetical protein
MLSGQYRYMVSKPAPKNKMFNRSWLNQSALTLGVQLLGAWAGQIRHILIKFLSG